MKRYINSTIKEYSDVLSKKTPVPGGGSAAALTAALAASLISMVANYSKGKSKSKRVEGKINNILKASEVIRKRLLVLVDLDAEAYLKIVKARESASLKKKKEAKKAARSVPQEICKLCYKAVALTPFLVENGNKYLLSDIEVAIELLLSAYNCAVINVEVNK